MRCAGLMLVAVLAALGVNAANAPITRARTRAAGFTGRPPPSTRSTIFPMSISMIMLSTTCAMPPCRKAAVNGVRNAGTRNPASANAELSPLNRTGKSPPETTAYCHQTGTSKTATITRLMTTSALVTGPRGNCITGASLRFALG